MANRLKDQTSPYLRQHADNPVDWHPWGKAAFDLAEQTDRPILLSIGYSACHWCHVMAHESFEDAEVAALMNRDYVNIKVDREEHPDVDQIYQHALQIFGQHGGWPLTMFLTPKGDPFYGGTYFPPRDNFGRPSFRRVLLGLAHAYQAQKTEVLEQGRKVVDGLVRMEARGDGQRGAAPAGADVSALPMDFTRRAAAKLALRMDPLHGGFAGAPKFPNAASLELQLRAFAGGGQAEDAQPVMRTLDRMAAGGIYDQLGGGFARYSTDEKWLVPHFEKMLYDNAQLLRLYAWGHQIASAAGRTGPPEGPENPETPEIHDQAARYAQVIRETHGWIEREMRGAAGGLYAAQDADSEGVEGKFFVWTPEQVRALCSPAEADVLMRCYDVRPDGNWNDPHGHGPRGASILHVVDSPRGEEEQALLRAAKDKLFSARRLRVPPGTDDKVLTGWNGLAISGLCEAGRILGAPELIDSARRTAEFLLDRLRDRQGRLLRVFTQGGPGEIGTARLPATLDDHAFLAEGLYTLAAASGELRYLDHAQHLMDAVLAAFYDEQTGSFYLAPAADAQHDAPLVARPTSLHDSAIPSGMSVACMNLLRLSELLGPARCPRYRQIAEQTLLQLGEQALGNPLGWSNLCNAIDLLQHGLTLIVIVYPAQADGPAAAAALRRAADSVRLNDPFILVAAENATAGRPASLPDGLTDLLSGKGPVGGKAAAYVCRNQSCSAAPVTDPAALTRLLAQAA